MNRTAERINGIEKATILLKSLGPEHSAKVLEYLSADEREVLSAQMVAIRPVSSVTRRSVIDEVTKHFRQASKRSATVGKPLAWIEEMEPEAVAKAFETERPQSAAMVLSLLSPACSANILALVDDKTKQQIVMRLATMKPISERALQDIDEAMREKLLSKNQVPVHSNPGSRTLSRIIDSAAQHVRTGITTVSSQSPAPSLVKSVSRFTNPEQMLELSDAEMYEVLSRLRMDDLIAILRVSSEDLKSKVTRNISPDSGKIVRKELSAPSKTTLRELEEASSRVLEALNRWSEAFQIPGRAA